MSKNKSITHKLNEMKNSNKQTSKNQIAKNKKQLEKSKTNLIGENNMISESQMKLLKRHRKTYTVEIEFDGGIEYETRLTPLPNGPHAPNRNESKELRKICSQTGLKVKDVRNLPVYREQLVESSKVSQKTRSKYWRILRKIRNIMVKTSGMNPLSSAFYKYFEKEWREMQLKHGLSPFNSHLNLSAKDAYLQSFN